MDYKNTVEGKEVQKNTETSYIHPVQKFLRDIQGWTSTTGQRSSLLLRLSADTRKRSALKAGIT